MLGEDVDLRVKALPDGFTHTLVVKTAEAAADPRLAELAFGLETTRLEISENDTGVLTAADTGSGSAVFEAPQPIMWDSSGEPEQAARQQATEPRAAEEPADGAKTARLEVEVAGGQLTLKPDQQMLAAPDTEFPVFIDPVWTTKKASSWAMVSSGYPGESYYKFAGKATEGMGRCEVAKDPNCVKDQTKRLFYRMPLPSLKGRHVDKVEFVAYETGAYDCDSSTSVQLWRTSALVSHATWSNTVGTWGNGGAWGEHLHSRDVAYCSSTPVEFSSEKLREHVQVGLDKGYGSMTFGLKAYNESSMGWWKRFADDAYLKIQYNNPPYQPNTGSMFANPGTKCVDKPDAKTVNAIPTAYAYLWDPDTEDSAKVRGQLTLHWANNADGSDWGEQWTGALTEPLTSGTRFQMKLPSTIPEKTLIAWGVRAYDGTQYGPWSYAGAQTGCYFYYDPSVPGAPVIASQEYPGDGSWNGGVGETGRFAVSDTEKVADRYEVSLNGEPVATAATAAGAERVVPVAPDRSGPNIVTVQAFAPSGQNGPVVSYEFNVNAGADPVARFTLDEDPGAPQAVSSGPGRPAWLRGGAALGEPGEQGTANPDDTALTLDGVDAFAESALPIADTTQSFSVSAWVKPSRYAMANVVAQNATFQSAFQLGIAPEGKPVFKKPATDTKDGGGGTWQQAISGTPLPTGQWSHLTGVYDKTAQQLRLYVDGDLEATTTGVTAPVESHGALQIGRSLYNGAFGGSWPGSIDDVQVFTHPLTDAQAAQLKAGTTPSGAGQVAHWTMDEAAGDARVYSTADPWKATLHNGAALGAEGQAGTALSLDNSDSSAGQYAATARPVVNTLRSFAVSAWLKVDETATSPSQNFTAVSVRGDYKSGFYLKYVATNNTWVFARTAHDSAETGWYQATFEGAQRGEWAQVVGVYDSIAQNLKIYVNGEKGKDSPQVTSRWLATGGLEIGRSQWAAGAVDYWAGEIDDVRVYDRIVGAQEAEELVTQHPVLKARWKLNTDGSGEPSGTAPALNLHNGAVVDPFAGFAYVSPAGLQLNRDSGMFAETAEPVVRTDESFTIAGWVRNIGRPQEAATVFSQAGSNANAFVLRYVPGTDPALEGAWQVEMRNEDTEATEDTEKLVAAHSIFLEYDWNHVAIVYDALRDRVSLYVDGSLEATAESQVGRVRAFEAANGGLQVGRNKLGAVNGTEFWPDAIDDIWAYQGALTQEQVSSLAGKNELPTDEGP
ncbi:LamG domain-containing protein [Actinomadura sp. LOL_011]|uniref:LamG domain-containing protein n=1 Tax=Actinomadura sp. LOL_011 TaxID=3345410 RepID=UPI003A806639